MPFILQGLELVKKASKIAFFDFWTWSYLHKDES